MNLTDVSGRLAKWRLRVLEFDYTVKFKKGAKNTVADAVSHLPTYGKTRTDPDLEIPCLLVEGESVHPLRVIKIIDVTSWEPQDWDDSDDAADRAVRSQCALGIVGTVDEDAPSAITLEEFRRAQASDRWCQAIRKNMNEEGSQYVTSTRLHTFYHTVIPSLSNLVHFI